MNAFVFLYRDVLDAPISEQIEHVRAKRHRRPPVVMTQSEVKRVMGNMNGTHLLMSQLLYGSGFRLMECIRLRIQDLDLERNKIYVRAGKGGKDRITILPAYIKSTLRDQVQKVRHLHDEDLKNGLGEVYMPEALGRKYRNAAKEFRWQYVFPAKK